jgi:hypothetical protein
MEKLRQWLDWADLLAVIGLLLLGVAVYQVGGVTGLIFYVGTLFVMVSLIISYQQGKNNAGG